MRFEEGTHKNGVSSPEEPIPKIPVEEKNKDREITACSRAKKINVFIINKSIY